MRTTKQLLIVVALTAALTLSARATFIADPNPGKVTKGFIDVHNADVTDFTMFVGGQNPSRPNVHVHTTGAVDTGSGYANIKPIKNGSLTDLLFTPANDSLFSDFNFRGQITKDTPDSLTVTVTDSNNVSFDIVFTGLGNEPHDFAR